MTLNKDNYYTDEANKAFMSVSTFKSWLSCESSAFAKMNGEAIEKKSQALDLGQYLHAWNEGELKQFTLDNKDKIYSKSGKIYAGYLKANKAINVLKNDPLCMKALEGEKEVIMIGEIDGLPWKIRIDNLHTKRFSDLKYIANFRPFYNEELNRKESFIEHWGYHYQMAVYQEIIRQNIKLLPEALIVAVTKEATPNKDIIGFSNSYLRETLEFVSNYQEHIRLVKKGNIEPKKCGICAHCIENKKLNEVKLFDGGLL